ncbi:MAG: bifunctional hydroxymethylpyrimidine kinase/phosphomethylpyrimidine kinase [Bacteroidia bacterium]|nr:bifunctional hydroxymethylpyrimidine kinase/phosphomethylpyrimidine kinase [Bacteroidia bacterium]
MKQFKRVLSIAGTDPSAGAGIQADLKTASALKVYCTTVITGVVNQNTQGVRDILPLSADWLEAQIRAVLDDVGTDAIKIGMLCNREQISVVARLIKEYGVRDVVLDPVLASTSGAEFLKKADYQFLLSELVPLVRLVTPNLPEAALLLGEELTEETPIAYLGGQLTKRTSTSVLIKGGHDEYTKGLGIVMDYLFDMEGKKPIEVFYGDYYQTRNTHGTGCTLSTAIASWLALKPHRTLAYNVGKAHEYVANAIKFAQGLEIGKGHGPLNHFWKFYNRK